MMVDLSRRVLLGGVAATAVPLETAAGNPSYERNPTNHGTGLDNRMRSDRAWERFLGAQDLVWKRLPRTWYEGPFLGDGFLGSMVYREPGRNAVRFTIQHSQVQDHRPQFGNEWGVARLPVGNLTLEPAGEITGVDLRLDLWNAELRGTVTTAAGRIALRAFIESARSLLVVVIRPTSGERAARLVFTPSKAVSPRTVREDPPAALTPNPDPVTRTEAGIGLVTQALVAGGQTATAYRETRTGRGERTLYLTVAHSYPELTAEQRVLETVRRAPGVPRLVREHRDWWHTFYRKSFISVPDGLLQSFYWIQLYKVASAARAEAPIMATTGPWLEQTPWPSVWYNLNAQLEYWLVYGSNHRELDPIPRSLVSYQRILVDALRPEYRHDSMGLRRSADGQFDDAGFVPAPGRASQPEIGNLPWLVHNAWLTYRHWMDESILRDVVFPILRKAMNYYLHFLALGNDGRLHLPPTFSPEYGNAPDCNYDLALIRWSCQTLLDAADRLGVDDPLAPRWREVLDTLVDYPVDANGFMVGTGEPFAKSHRHYSHMLAVYPLYLVTGDQPAERDLIERSLRHWISFEGALRGYSFTGASSISSVLGKGDDALRYLREFVARFAQPNTHYFEAGPVIETPLSGAQSIHDMLCQSWGGVIRVFPAVPRAWGDVTLHDFRVEGAFLVSAVRRGGVTSFVRVRSEAGEPCRVRTGITGPLVVRDPRGRDPRWRDLGDGTIEIDLAVGREVLIHRAATRPDLTIAPVRVTQPAPPWGLQPLPPSGSVQPVDLEAHFDNDGITNEFFMGDGDFDGTGSTYPAAQIPQTGAVIDDGIQFVVVNGVEGTKNNVTASGQSVAVPAGRYRRLHLLGASDNGNTDSTLTVRYADDQTGTVPLRLTDWKSSPAFGETEAIRTTQYHTRTGARDVKVAIFHQVVELDPVRELRSIDLPVLTGPRPHLFAMSLEKPE